MQNKEVIYLECRSVGEEFVLILFNIISMIANRRKQGQNEGQVQGHK